ncbi:MAG TPA: KH domain-containing protein [Thermoanaerobaculia bacterium]|nr:KH domain-containing protein [Thermoanaerobaculia bacterium]
MASTVSSVTRVLEQLADHPQGVRVREVPQGRHCIVEVRAHPEDMGALIGRGGRTAEALRALLRARGERSGRTYDLRIREHDQR